MALRPQTSIARRKRSSHLVSSKAETTPFTMASSRSLRLARASNTSHFECSAPTQSCEDIAKLGLAVTIVERKCGCSSVRRRADLASRPEIKPSSTSAPSGFIVVLKRLSTRRFAWLGESASLAPLSFNLSAPGSKADENSVVLRRVRNSASSDIEGCLTLSLIHISEPTRQAEISYAVFCLKK